MIHRRWLFSFKIWLTFIRNSFSLLWEASQKVSSSVLCLTMLLSFLWFIQNQIFSIKWNRGIRMTQLSVAVFGSPWSPLDGTRHLFCKWKKDGNILSSDDEAKGKITEEPRSFCQRKCCTNTTCLPVGHIQLCVCLDHRKSTLPYLKVCHGPEFQLRRGCIYISRKASVQTDSHSTGQDGSILQRATQTHNNVLLLWHIAAEERRKRCSWTGGHWL